MAALATATTTSIISTPNNTLYVSNIDWKIKKPLLRRALYMLFTRHGKVLEIIALRREGLRGQAWVIMDDVQAATAAVQSANGFSFFGKDLKVSYAKETSDRIAKRDGSYVPKAKRQKMKQQQQKQQEPPPPPATAATTTEGGGDDDMTGNGGSGGDDGGAAAGSSEGGGGTVVPPPPPPPPPAAAAPSEKPSHILFAQELPDECNEMMLGMLFRQYKGFKEVRIPRPGLAFIEFETEAHATIAYEALNGFKLTTTDTLKLSYGKA